jgi:hypothetical protein
MAYRKKGQRSKLLDLAKKSRARAQARRAAKAKKPVSKAARTRTEMNTPKGTTLRPIRAVKPPLRKMKGGTNLSARAGQVDPTKRTPKQPTRTPAQRAAAKKKLLAEQKTLRKKSAGMRYGSEFKIPKLGKKEQNDMARAMELGSGGGLVKAGIGAGLGAAALKAQQMYKAKKAKDLASGKTGGTSAGIGKTRAASAASRTSGLGKAKGTPKKKPAKRKSGPSKFLSNILKKAAGYGKPKSAFTKTPKKKTQRRYPK